MNFTNMVKRAYIILLEILPEVTLVLAGLFGDSVTFYSLLVTYVAISLFELVLHDIGTDASRRSLYAEAVVTLFFGLWVIAVLFSTVSSDIYATVWESNVIIIALNFTVMTISFVLRVTKSPLRILEARAKLSRVRLLVFAIFAFASIVVLIMHTENPIAMFVSAMSMLILYETYVAVRLLSVNDIEAFQKKHVKRVIMFSWIFVLLMIFYSMYVLIS